MLNKIKILFPISAWIVENLLLNLQFGEYMNQ